MSVSKLKLAQRDRPRLKFETETNRKPINRVADVIVNSGSTRKNVKTDTSTVDVADEDESGDKHDADWGLITDSRDEKGIRELLELTRRIRGWQESPCVHVGSTAPVWVGFDAFLPALESSYIPAVNE